MRWNWQLPNWPHFTYEKDAVSQQEREFLLQMGTNFVYLKNSESDVYNQFVVEILTIEGIETSRIEGEILDRESLQSSLKKQFGLLSTPHRSKGVKEAPLGELLYEVHRSFDTALTHEMVQRWHGQLFKDSTHVEEKGLYRTHEDPMQIISNRLGSSPHICFEAPPSKRVLQDMELFIRWFNTSLSTEPVLGRAALSHIFFESIHPFEDGNGRIGRLILEKALSQGVKHPVLLGVSRVLEKQKKAYYTALEGCNRTLSITPAVEFFAKAILQAQQESISLFHFLMEKTTLLTRLAGQINPRQEKVLLRLFSEGIGGFKGGLSAENYISITHTSRATATRDLTDLVEKGALVKKGELRHTRYELNIPHSLNRL